MNRRPSATPRRSELLFGAKPRSRHRKWSSRPGFTDGSKLKDEKDSWFPVLPGQADLLLARNANPSASDSVSYHLEIAGPLDVASMTQALSDSVDHFECLRLCFRAHGETFSQMVAPTRSGELRLELLDIGDVPPSAAERYIARLFYQDASSWDVWNDPGYFYRLIRRTSTHHYLLITVQHVNADVYSSLKIEDFILERYRLLNEGQEDSPALAPSLRAAVEAILPRNYTGAGDSSFWFRTLSDLAETRKSPARHRTPVAVTTVERDVPTSLWERVMAGLESQKVSRASWLLAQFAGFSDVNGTESVSVIDGHFRLRSRKHAEVQGMFSVSRPVVMFWDPERTRSDVAREALLAAQLHQRVDSFTLRGMEKELTPYFANSDFNYVPNVESIASSPTLELPGLVLAREWNRPDRIHARPARLAVNESNDTVHLALQVDEETHTSESGSAFLDSLSGRPASS